MSVGVSPPCQCARACDCADRAARFASPTGQEAADTMVNSFADLADDARQIATDLGARPYRVFLVWTKYTGDERGAGVEVEMQRIEILPRPKVESLDAISLTLFAAGNLPVGSVRISRISTCYTADQLSGRMLPTAHEDHIPEPWDFYWEIMEDGRGDRDPLRQKFRVLSPAVRRATKIDWTVTLERRSEDASRDGASQLGTDVVSRLLNR